jgi:hypothetical protein
MELPGSIVEPYGFAMEPYGFTVEMCRKVAKSRDFGDFWSKTGFWAVSTGRTPRADAVRGGDPG